MGITYFKSENVKVFPCAYRGQNGTTVFNPEARLNTEYNLTHTSTSFKDSYIVDWHPQGSTQSTTLCCVIGGYYFELSDVAMLDFVNSETKAPKYLVIKKYQVTFAGTTEKTWVLNALRDDSTYENLDVYISGEGSQAGYRFVGLGLADDIPTEAGSHYLQVAEYVGDTLKVKYDEFLPKIFAGTGTSLIGNTQVSTSIHTYGNTASGANSAAFGVGTNANIDGVTVVGTYNATAANGDLFIVGNGSSTAKSNAFKVRKNEILSNIPVTINNKVSIYDGLSAGGDLIELEAPTINIWGDINQYDLDEETPSQVTFNGNVDANNGLDVVGDFTVGPVSGSGTAVSATFNADIYANNKLTIDNCAVFSSTAATIKKKLIIEDKNILLKGSPVNDDGRIEINYNYNSATTNLKMFGNFDSTNNYNPAIELGSTASGNAYGYLKLWDGSGTQTEGATPSIELNGSTHTISLKAASAGVIYNSIKLDGSANKLTFNTSSALAAIAIDGNDGTIKLQKPDGQTVVQLDTTGAITGTTITGTTIKNSNNYYMPTVTKKITTNSSGSSSSTLLTQKAMKLVVWESKEDLSSGSDPHSEISYTTLGMTTVYAAVACSRNTGNVSGTTHKNSLTAFIDATNSKVIVYSDEAADKDGFYCIIIGY